MKTIIREVVYKLGLENVLLVPHKTGRFEMIDCDYYLPMDSMKLEFNNEYINKVKDDYIEYQGIKYYYAGFTPEYVENDWVELFELGLRKLKF